MTDFTTQFTPQELNTEEWRDVPGYEGIYQASTLGRIRSLDRHVTQHFGRYVGNKIYKKGRILRIGVTPKGYVQIFLTNAGGEKRGKEVHALVGLTFLGPLPKAHHVHHKDDDKLNNRLTNLMHLDKHTHGHITHRGENCHKAVLVEAQVLEIRWLLAQGMFQKDIAAIYGVARSTIGEIKRGKSWTYLHI
jgi:hypothetical protein